MRRTAALLVLFALLACGGAARESSAPSAATAADVRAGAPMAAPAPMTQAMNRPASPAPAQLAARPVNAKTGPEGPHSPAMLIYTASLSLAVFQVDKGLDAVERIGHEVGGYLSARQDTSLTIRVPRERFDEAVDRIESLGDVLHRDIRAQDVTDEYVDLDARLKNAYAMRARLQDLLSKAAVKEALDIEVQLGRVTEEIERMEGKLKLLRDQMAFSTITATFERVTEQPVRDTTLSAFPWLESLGLPSLLDVHP